MIWEYNDNRKLKKPKDNGKREKDAESTDAKTSSRNNCRNSQTLRSSNCEPVRNETPESKATKNDKRRIFGEKVNSWINC